MNNALCPFAFWEMFGVISIEVVLGTGSRTGPLPSDTGGEGFAICVEIMTSTRTQLNPGVGLAQQLHFNLFFRKNVSTALFCQRLLY